MTTTPALARRLGLFDAVAIGLGSMIGAGIFSVFAPAAAAAGGGLVIGLAIAAIVAWCNAASSAQLAAQYPASGGTYVFGRERLGEWPGFVAGWSFVVGKTASLAAMALVFAAYVAPGPLQKPVAIVIVLVMSGVTAFGISRTALATKIIVGFVLVVLLALIVIALTRGAGGENPFAAVSSGSSAGISPYGVLQSAGLLFFAFAGYARIATLGEEVRDPARTIPRAISISLAAVLVLYAMIAAVTLGTLGVDRLSRSAAPLQDVARSIGVPALEPILAVAAAAATAGAILALSAGIARTALAMARNRDLPAPLAVVHPRFHTPVRAELVIALVVTGVILIADVRGVIGFSSFGVLLYYFVANAAALTQKRGDRRFPRAVSALGALGCIVLVVTLPPAAIAGGVAVVALGIVYRIVSRRLSRA